MENVQIPVDDRTHLIKDLLDNNHSELPYEVHQRDGGDYFIKTHGVIFYADTDSEKFMAVGLSALLNLSTIDELLFALQNQKSKY